MTRSPLARKASQRPLPSVSSPSFALTPIAALVATLAVFGPSIAAAQQAAPTPADAASAAPAAEEPQNLGQVVVRSRNRIEKLQDVPLSVSVVTGQELQRLDATDIAAITRRVGNISWNNGNQRTSSLAIRGIGKVGQTEAQDPSVGINVDGVSYAYNALTSSFDFTDIETIEVARGPQGTLLGKNSTLGSVIITTRKPSFVPSADYSLSFQQRGGFKGTLAAGGPVIDDLLAWRGVFSVSRQEGDYRNSLNRDQTFGNTDRVSGRVKFLFTPTSDFNALVSLDRQPRAAEYTNGRTVQTPTPTTYSNGTAVTALNNDTRLKRRWFTQNTGYSLTGDFYNDGTGILNNDSARPLVTGSNGATAELNWKLRGGYTLTSVTAYKDYHFNAFNDEGTPFDVYKNSGGFWNDFRQVSQEVRVSSPTGGFLDHQGGLYFINVHNTVDYQRIWGDDAGAWLATNTQYNYLDQTASGRTLLTNSLANLNMSYNSPTGLQYINNKSYAAFWQGNWHLTPATTLTTGLRLTKEERTNTGSSFVRSYGNAPELNPASLGGFANDTAGNLTTNSASQLAVANATALKYFGVADYNTLTTAQKQQIAYAKQIRSTAMGTMFPATEAEPYSAIQPAFVISPSYKFSDQATGYFSYQHGEKAGIAQFTNGVSNQVKAEKTDSYELGIKTSLLNRTLTLNADVFLMNIKNYQQSLRIIDQVATQGLGQQTYVTATGNAPKVRVTGLEVDAFYTGLRNTQLRFSGAYNRAVYKSFPNAPQPDENGYNGAPAFRDLSGQILAGAPLFTFNLGGDWRKPVSETKEIFTSANVAYNTKFNSDVNLSSYGWVPASFTVDAAVGWGAINKNFTVSLIVKNLFDNRTPIARTWNSYTPQFQRTAGIQLTGKL